jgi:hypothetical protein
MKLIMENWRKYTKQTKINEDRSFIKMRKTRAQLKAREIARKKKQEMERKRYNQYILYVLGPSQGIDPKDEKKGIKRVGKKAYDKVYDHRHGTLKKWDGVKPWLKGGTFGSVSLEHPHEYCHKRSCAIEHYGKGFHVALEMLIWGTMIPGASRYAAAKAMETYTALTGKTLTRSRAAELARIGLTPAAKVKPVVPDFGFPNLIPPGASRVTYTGHAGQIEVTMQGRKFMFDSLEDLWRWNSAAPMPGTGARRVATLPEEEFKIILVPVTDLSSAAEKTWRLKLYHGTNASKPVAAGNHAIYTTASPHRAAGYARAQISGTEGHAGPALFEIEIAPSARIYEIPEAVGAELWSLSEAEVLALREAGVDVIVERNAWLAKKGPEYDWAVEQGWSQTSRASARAPTKVPWTPEEYVEYIIINPKVVTRVKRLDSGARLRSTYGRSLEPPPPRASGPAYTEAGSTGEASRYIDDLVHTGCRESWCAAVERRIFSSQNIGIVEKAAVEKEMVKRYGEHYKGYIRDAEKAELEGAQIRDYMERRARWRDNRPHETHAQAVKNAREVDPTPWKGFE